jgi:hypothetical protein
MPRYFIISLLLLPLVSAPACAAEKSTGDNKTAVESQNTAM